MKNKPYPYCNVPEMKDIKDMIFRNAQEIPDKTAFVYPCESGEMKKTFLDLKDDVVAFGSWMYSKKLKDKRVAIVGENSYEWLVIYMATICGGSVAVAIDKSLPEDEIAGLAKLADVDTAFISDTYFDKVGKKICRKSWSMKEFEEILSEGRKLARDGEAKEFIDYSLEPDRVSTILFTSGTSGVSKAVQLTNWHITYEITHTSMLYQPTGGVLAVLPFHHAFGLVVGILMVVNWQQPIFINKSLKYVKKNMEEFGPQTMFLVPMFVEFFHKQIWAEVKKKGKTKSAKKAL